MHTLRTIIFVFGKKVLLRKPSLWSAGFVRRPSYLCRYGSTIWLWAWIWWNCHCHVHKRWELHSRRCAWMVHQESTAVMTIELNADPSWNHDEKQFLHAKCKMQLACSFPSFHIISYHFISFHIISLIRSIQVIARPHLRSRLEASEVSWQVSREQWGIAIITICSRSMVMIIPYHAGKKFENLKFSCLGKEFIIDGLRFF